MAGLKGGMASAVQGNLLPRAEYQLTSLRHLQIFDVSVQLPADPAVPIIL